MKLKTYAILMRHKVTKVIYGYLGGNKLKFSPNHCQIYRRHRDWQNWSKVKDINIPLNDWVWDNTLLEQVEKIRKEIEDSYPDFDVFITRLGSKKCPIIVNWNDLVEAKSNGERIDSTTWHYRSFKMKT